MAVYDKAHPKARIDNTQNVRLAACMGTKTLMSVDEYLHTTFDGADREYLDGEVVERNMGNKSHGRLQGWLVRLLGAYEERTGLYVIPEVRHRVQKNSLSIPDIAVFEGEPEGEVPSMPPLVAIGNTFARRPYRLHCS